MFSANKVFMNSLWVEFDKFVFVFTPPPECLTFHVVHWTKSMSS